MLRNEDGDGRPLALTSRNVSGGHSVVPYKLVRTNGSTFDLQVYDNQAAGTSQVVVLDSAQNRWIDLTTANLGQGTTGCFLEFPCGYYLYTDPILPPLPDSPADNPSASGLDGIIIYNTVNAGINITSSSGHSIGFQDSLQFGDIEDGIPIIPLTGGYQPPVGYYIPDDQYSIQMDNFSDSLAYTLFLTDSTLYEYQRFDPGTGETDMLGYSSYGVTMSNPDQVSKSINFQTVLQEGASAEKVFSADNLALSSGDSIHIRESERSMLVIQNYGQNSTYNLTVSAASLAGRSVFQHNSIPLDQNSAHQIVPDWNDLENSPVRILIDYGNDGTLDDSIFINNQATGIENNYYEGIPGEYRLLQNYPNPFNPATTITFDLPEQSRVELTVYNILGQQVAVLVNELRKAGRHQAVFDASGLSSGIYFYRLSTDTYTETRKMLLIK